MAATRELIYLVSALILINPTKLKRDHKYRYRKGYTCPECKARFTNKSTAKKHYNRIACIPRSTLVKKHFLTKKNNKKLTYSAKTILNLRSSRGMSYIPSKIMNREITLDIKIPHTQIPFKKRLCLHDFPNDTIISNYEELQIDDTSKNRIPVFTSVQEVKDFVKIQIDLI